MAQSIEEILKSILERQKNMRQLFCDAKHLDKTVVKGWQ